MRERDEEAMSKKERKRERERDEEAMSKKERERER